ncbi:unnamed protein product [Leptidea sinapis]|uniref:Ion transport domain-containing protein n=1 Tax=Leptidea sinapis TaxID=189913 RepID=A0A5E4QLN8_9NEOP|nr:unnamed protein product [Leptidea sinapis]
MNDEGLNNEKFDSHPSSPEELPAYLMVHNPWYHGLDLLASLVLILLAFTEDPAVPAFELPVWAHGTIELLALTIIGVELHLKLKWIGWGTIFKHKRTMIKTLSDSFVSMFVLLTTANFPDVMMPSYAKSKWYAVFFILYIITVLYVLMNLMLAVVYETFTRIEREKCRALLLHRRGAARRAFRLLVSRRAPHAVKLRHFAGLVSHYAPHYGGLDVYLMFKQLNQSGTGGLSRTEFANIYEVFALRWVAQSSRAPWLMRLYKLKKRYRDVFGTLVLLSPLMSSAGCVMLVINTTVEDFYRFSENSSSPLGYYYLNNFENILTSGVTLFELTVVNNWFILMNAGETPPRGSPHELGGGAETGRSGRARRPAQGTFATRGPSNVLRHKTTDERGFTKENVSV